MRAIILAVLVISGCGDDSTADDMSVVTHDLSVGDLASSKCSVAKQDCPMGSKCTYTVSGLSYVPHCVTVTGTLAEKAPCMITGGNDAGMIDGNDECGANLICLLEPTGAASCHKFCAKDTDCTALTKGICGAPNICFASCDIYGGDCPAGQSCTATEPRLDGKNVGACAFSGSTPIDGACTSNVDCVTDTRCAGTPKKCRPVCNTAHPCASGSCLDATTGNPATDVNGYCTG